MVIHKRSNQLQQRKIVSEPVPFPDAATGYPLASPKRQFLEYGSRMRKVEIPEGELDITTSRSGGPGGQNVNKVESRVTVAFDLAASSIFSAAEKARLYKHTLVRRRLDSAGRIVVTCQEHRTQALNRTEAIERLTALLEEALVPPKRRIATKPTKASRVRRRELKQHRSATKRARRVDTDDD